MRQQVVHGLHLLLPAGAGEKLPGALNQVVGLAARTAQRFGVGLHAPFADVAVGVQPIVQSHDLDREPLLGEQGDGLFSGVGPGGVWIEVDHDLRGVAAQ